MEIVQTGTGTWPWCTSIFGARFAVFVRRARVLLTPVYATRNLSFLRFHRHRHPVVATRNFYWDSMGWCVKIPQDGKLPVVPLSTYRVGVGEVRSPKYHGEDISPHSGNG